MTMGGIRGLASIRDVLKGRVTMSDGKTPAMGAMVYFFDAGGSQPTFAGIADPAGNIRAAGRWTSGEEGTSGGRRSQRPRGRRVVAGVCGAVVAAPVPGKPLEIVLPAPQAFKAR